MNQCPPTKTKVAHPQKARIAKRFRGFRHFDIICWKSKALLTNGHNRSTMAPFFLKLHQSKDLGELSRSLQFELLTPHSRSPRQGSPAGRKFFKTPFLQKNIPNDTKKLAPPIGPRGIWVPEQWPGAWKKEASCSLLCDVFVCCFWFSF